MEKPADSHQTPMEGGVTPRNPRDERWYFGPEEAKKTPSIMAGCLPYEESWYRYQCAELIQTIGQRLGLLQIAINTAILYMHRFYQLQSLKRFHRHTMAPVFVFLAAKVEEQPRRLESVVRCSYKLLHPSETVPLSVDSEQYLEEMQNMVTHENVVLQTLAFDLRVEHPHTHVIRCCNIIHCEKYLSQAAYALASCALHFTKVCVTYRPVLVACMCIHVAAKWINVKIPLSTQEKPWFLYMDSTLTEDQIQRVANDFLDSVSQYPSRVRDKIRAQVTPADANNSGGDSGFKPGPSGFAASGTASTSQPSGQPSSVHPPTVRPSSGSMARGHPPSVPRPPAGRPPHNPPPPPPSMVDTKPSLGGVNSRHLDGDRIRSEDKSRQLPSTVPALPRREDLKRPRENESFLGPAKFAPLAVNGTPSADSSGGALKRVKKESDTA